MNILQIGIFLWGLAAAGPVPESLGMYVTLAKPPLNYALSFPRNPRSGFGIFRRQGNCPINTLPCDNTVCCAYDASCCGSTCCDFNSLCTGIDSNGSPCCVALGSATNSCGSSSSDPCASYPGTVLCTNMNVCCPPDSYCYYDSNGSPSCASPSSVTPTAPASSSFYDVPAASTVYDVPASSSTIDYSSTPVSLPDEPTIPPNPFAPSKSSFWRPATIGGIAGGGGCFLILLAVLICCCAKKNCYNGSKKGGTGSTLQTGGYSGGKTEKEADSVSKQPATASTTKKESTKQPTVVPDLHEHKLPESGTQDLPREERGDRNLWNLASDSMKGTIVYDPVTVSVEKLLSPEEEKRKREHKDAIRKANSPLYANLSLIEGAGKIRILTLIPNKNKQAPIECKIKIVSMDAEYEALSYTWGDPYRRKNIRIKGFNFSVTAELESTLRQLRSSTKRRSIWIDAICIDQNNPNERHWHMKRMLQIYHKASRTLIWLGEGTTASDKAMKFFNQRGRVHASIPALLEDFKANKDSWLCLQDLLEKKWWSRLWIVGEVVVSRNALILCGNESIEFLAIPKMFGIAIKYNLDIFSYSTYTSQYRRNAILLEHFRVEAQSRNSLNLEWWIRVFGFKQGCEKPKDKLWALLGLAGDREHSALTWLRPDESVCALYTKIATHCISYTSQPGSGKDIDFICLGRGARRNQNLNLSDVESKLPSWVPDLTLAPWDSYSTLTRKSWLSPFPRQFWRKEDDFHASRPREKNIRAIVGGHTGFVLTGTAQISFSDSGQVLTVAGVIEDIVEDLGQVYNLKLTPENVAKGSLTPFQVQHHRQTLREIGRLTNKVKHKHTNYIDRYPRTGSTYDLALQRTLVCDRNAKNERLGPDTNELKNFKLGADGELIELSQGRGPLDSDFDEHSMDSHFQRLHRKFMTSEHGYIGLVPPETQKGDVICILYGCSVPVILRPLWDITGLEGPGMTATFIGECYVHGIMDGEVVHDVSEGKAFACNLELE